MSSARARPLHWLPDDRSFTNGYVSQGDRTVELRATNGPLASQVFSEDNDRDKLFRVEKDVTMRSATFTPVRAELLNDWAIGVNEAKMSPSGLPIRD